MKKGAMTHHLCPCGCNRQIEQKRGVGRKRVFYSSNCRVKFFRYTSYGCSPELYLDLYERQGGLCAVCRLSKPLVVDHCHVTQVVRGLLCNNCNTALGMLADQPERILSLWRYLQQ